RAIDILRSQRVIALRAGQQAQPVPALRRLRAVEQLAVDRHAVRSLPGAPQRLGLQGHQFVGFAEALPIGVDIGQRSEVTPLRLAFADQRQHQLRLGGLAIGGVVVFGLPHQRLLLLLLLDQFPRRLHLVRLATGQQRDARAERKPGRHGRKISHHIPPAMRDSPRSTDKMPMPPVTISSAGSRVSIMTPVIFTVRRPILSLSSNRRLSRMRCEKRLRGSCPAPPWPSTCTSRRQLAARSSLSNPCDRRASDCSRVRPRAYRAVAEPSSWPSTGKTTLKSLTITLKLWSTERPTPCSRRSRSTSS